MTLVYGQVVLRKTCKLCGKRRDCRVDTINHYFTAEASGKLIPVCLMKCSTYGTGLTKTSAKDKA